MRKWKRKSGCYRSYESGAQVRIRKELDIYEVSMRMPNGAWEDKGLFSTMKAATVHGCELLDAFKHEVEKRRAEELERRLDTYPILDDMFRMFGRS